MTRAAGLLTFAAAALASVAVNAATAPAAAVPDFYASGFGWDYNCGESLRDISGVPGVTEARRARAR
jgi:hypothetical protein